ncbi:MAG TPA: hypothetical protein VNT30_09400 [Stellaceae bacterium]|nr:hypothetical protein [Stellaceae bacterium]
MVPLTAELLALLPLPDAALSGFVSQSSFVRDAVEGSQGFVMLDGGYVVGAGGVGPIWPGRAVAWMLVGGWARPRHLAAAFPFVRDLLARLQVDPAYRRIECTVPTGFAGGALWACRLGFVPEGVMRGYGLHGEDHELYARYV